MTRMFRAIPLSFVRLPILSALAAVALIASAGTASAGIFDFLSPHRSDTAEPAPPADSDADSTTTSADDAKSDDASTAAVAASIADIAPSIEIPLHHLYCVEYAR
ncbi:MAG TPA: hypothetical protein VIJ85_02300, partial [Rhizomicrobium sp.]